MQAFLYIHGARMSHKDSPVLQVILTQCTIFWFHTHLSLADTYHLWFRGINSRSQWRHWPKMSLCGLHSALMSRSIFNFFLIQSNGWQMMTRIDANCSILLKLQCSRASPLIQGVGSFPILFWRGVGDSSWSWYCNIHLLSNTHSWNWCIYSSILFL